MIDADPGSGLVKVGGGTVLADLNEELARARAGDGEPRRHRPADDLRRDLDRHPRDRRPAAQHLGPGRGAGAGPRRRQRPPPQRRDRPRSCCGRRGSGSARWARSPRSPCAASRPSPCCGSTRRTRARRCSTPSTSAPTAHEHFELFTFPYADSALVLERNRIDGAAAPARPRRRLPQRRRARELGAGAAGRRPARRCRGRSRRSRGSPAASPPAAAPATAATASSSTSAGCASRRWSTGCRARPARRRRGG